jgi:ABC-type transport system involved in multi-copper enzyme maturation permease subunit
MGAPSTKQISLLDSLASVWIKILVLIVYLVVAFAVSYVVFMRMDIR